jgi:hypothetical protein
LLREVVRLGDKDKIEVPMYEGNLDAKEMLDWIRSMDKHLTMKRSMKKKGKTCCHQAKRT